MDQAKKFTCWFLTFRAIKPINNSAKCDLKRQLIDLNVLIFLYDVTHKLSFIEAKEMISSLHNLAPHNSIKILIGNKSDLEQHREVTKAEGQALAHSFGFSFFEVSSTGDRKQIDSVFIEIGKSEFIRTVWPAHKSKRKSVYAKRAGMHKVRFVLIHKTFN